MHAYPQMARMKLEFRLARFDKLKRARKSLHPGSNTIP